MCLTSFAYHVFEVYPCYRMYQYFSLFDCWIIFFYIYTEAKHFLYLFILSRKYRTSYDYWVVMLWTFKYKCLFEYLFQVFWNYIYDWNLGLYLGMVILCLMFSVWWFLVILCLMKPLNCFFSFFFFLLLLYPWGYKVYLVSTCISLMTNHAEVF